MRLGLRVRQKEGEGALELALRLAVRNGYSDLPSFLRACGISTRAKFFDDAVAKIAELSGFPASSLVEWSVMPAAAPNQQFRGEILIRGAHVPSYRRYCPLCLADDYVNAEPDEPEASIAYIRGWWRTPVIYACPTHHCAMVDACEECGKRTPVDALPVDSCECGFRFRNSKTTSLCEEQLSANNYLAGRLSLSAPLSVPDLDHIPMWQAANVMRQLGAAALFGRREAHGIPVGQIDEVISYHQAPADLARLLSTGLRYARGGSASLRQLMEKMIEGDKRLYSGPAEMFGSKFRNWAIHMKNPIRHRIEEVWSPFIAEHCKARRKMNRPEGPRPVHLSARPQLLHALEKARLEAVLSRPLTTSRRTEGFEAGRQTNILLTQKGAFNQLGVSPFVMRKLVEQGLLVPAWHSDVPHVQPFFLDDLCDLIDKIEGRALPIETARNSMTFAQVASRLGPSAVPVLIQRILRDEMVVFGKSKGPSLAGLRVPVRATRATSKLAHLTKLDIASMMGVAEETVDDLIKFGCLRAIGGNSNALIELEIAEQFNIQYVTARRLAQICSSKIAPAAIEEWFQKLDVTALMPAGYVGFYPRSTAVRAFYRNWTTSLEPRAASLENSYAADLPAAPKGRKDRTRLTNDQSKA